MFIERQDIFREEKVAGHNYDFRNFFFPQQFSFWLIFQSGLKCIYSPFLHFPHSTLFTSWVFLGFVVGNCEILVQLTALFRRTSSPLKHLATSNSRNFLILISPWRYNIFKTFNFRDLSFKRRRKFFVTFLKFPSRDIFFNILYFPVMNNRGKFSVA